MIRAAVAAVLTGTVLAGSTALAVPVAGTEQTTIVSRAPGEIAHDCSVDVTDTLTDWIASVPDGGTAELAPEGCYRIDGTVTIANRVGLEIAGNNAVLRAGTEGDQGRRHLRITGGSELTVRDLIVRGALPNTRLGPEPYREEREFQHGIELRGVTGVTLEQVRVLDVFGDFVYVGRGSGGVPSTDVVVRDSRFNGSGRQGIAITAGRRVVIERNEIRGVGLSMFDLEPNSDGDPAQQIEITNNVTGGAGSFWLSNPGTGRVNDVTVADNVMTKPTSGLVWMVAPAGGVVGPVTIERNQLLVSDTVYAAYPVGAFYFDRCDGVSITNNVATFPDSTLVNAVEVRDCRNVHVDGNTFVGAGELLVDNTGAPNPVS